MNLTAAQQIAEIGAKNITGFSLSDKSDANGQEPKFAHVIVKELFVRPSAAYPKGRYVVVAGETVLKDDPELPYDFGPQAANPYPVVEFIDMLTAGQFWTLPLAALGLFLVLRSRRSAE